MIKREAFCTLMQGLKGGRRGYRFSGPAWARAVGVLQSETTDSHNLRNTNKAPQPNETPQPYPSQAT